MYSETQQPQVKAASDQPAVTSESLSGQTDPFRAKLVRGEQKKGPTFSGEAGDVLSQVLEAPALQINRELEEGDSVGAADGPTARHQATGRLQLLQECREH